MGNLDKSFLNERITIAYETPALFVRKLYYEILTFSRASKCEIHANERVNEILSFPKDIENRVIEKRTISNDLIEYKEYSTRLLKSYKL
jgi:hypothetical protein